MEPNIERVLYPVDFDSPNHMVLPYVAGLADRFGAQLHLLHVAPGVDIYAGVPQFDQMRSELEEAGREALAAFVAEHLPNRRGLVTAVAKGAVAQAIIRYARDPGVDLIAMGTHGRKGLEHALLGSVAEKVVRLAPVPVLTINPFREEAEREAAPRPSVGPL